MTFSFDPQEPTHWRRFCQLVFSHAPAFPLGTSSSSATSLQSGTSAVGAVSTIAAAGGANIHPAIDAATGLAGSGSASDVANVGVDTLTGHALSAFLEGVPGGGTLGLIVGNGVSVLRGSLEAIARSDEVDDYLQQFFGYKMTLARTAIRAASENEPYARLPDELIPSYLNDRFHVPRHRGSFRRGAMRVQQVISGIDEVSTPGDDHYSKQCFLHVFLVSAGLVTTQEGRSSFRTRDRVVEYVENHMLARNIDRDRARLMQYGMRGG